MTAKMTRNILLMLAATVLLHGAGLAAGWALRNRQVWLARAAGAGVAAFGGALLLQQMA